MPKRALAQTAMVAVFSMRIGRVGVADEFWGTISWVKSGSVKFGVALVDNGVVIVTVEFWGPVGCDFWARKARQMGDNVAKSGRCPHFIFKNSSFCEGSLMASHDAAKRRTIRMIAGIFDKIKSKTRVSLNLKSMQKQ